jgi:hypothetical protein
MQLPERKINVQSKVTVRRMLPISGEILVQRGQTVEALDVVAQAQMPHRYHMIDVARQLAQPNVEMSEVMTKSEGDSVEANEVIAQASGGLPFLQRKVRAPVAGYIAATGPGWVLLESEHTQVELLAFINGQVSGIVPDRGVVLEASGVMIEAACGFGGEAYGTLKRLVNDSFETISAAAIDASLKNSIILAGRSVDEEILRQAEAEEVQGIIVGSIDASLLKLDPPVKVKVVATEGFGDMPMSSYTFGILGRLGGREVSIRGQTPNVSLSPNRDVDDSRHVILATSGKASSLAARSAEKEVKHQLEVGSRVRITRGRFLGASGTIKALPAQPQPTEAGLLAPGAIITLPDASPFIPLVNLEQIV